MVGLSTLKASPGLGVCGLRTLGLLALSCRAKSNQLSSNLSSTCAGAVASPKRSGEHSPAGRHHTGTNRGVKTEWHSGGLDCSKEEGPNSCTVWERTA